MDECKRPSALAMDLLAHRVPLTLLLDLAEPNGPDSREIMRSERVYVKVFLPSPRLETQFVPWQRQQPSV